MPCLVEQRAQEKLLHKVSNNEVRTLKLSCEGPKITFDLSSNDYLGLSQNASVINAAIKATQMYGTSSSGSPVVNAYLPPHRELQNELCSWLGFSEALLWNSGYTANEAILSLIPQKGDIVLADELVHYSMLSGVLQSGARLIRFRHNNLEDLHYYLKKYSARTKILITESLYSMDGDSPNLQQIAQLKSRYGFFWILDEAHALGWYGPQGRGLAHHYNVADQVDILIATLGKSLASQGAFSMIKSPSIHHYILNYAKPFIYTTFPAPALAASASQAIRLIKNTLYKNQATWHKNAQDLRSVLLSLGAFTYQGTSPIIPLVLKDNVKTIKAHEHLKAHGVQTACIRPPTVPQGSSRLRLSLNTGINIHALIQHLCPLLEGFIT